VCVPSFVDVEIGGKVRTAVRITVTPRGEESTPIEDAQDQAVSETEA